MALLRVSGLALGLALVAGCGQAGAQPTATATSGLEPPAGWRALPEIAAAAATAAATDGVTLEGTEAGGEPARGCYAVWIALRARRVTADAVLAGIEERGIATTELVQPETEDGVLSATFERAPYRGRLRARLAAGRLEAIACFASEREPTSCEAPCTMLLGGLR